MRHNNSKYLKEFDNWADMYNAGSTITEISVKYKCSRSNIRRRLVRMGIEIRPPVFLTGETGRSRWESPIFAYNELVIKNETGCWGWSGILSQGYGCFCVKGKSFKAHRYSYEIHRGEVGDNFVCHSCDNPICSNPDHLFLGDCGDNIRDCYKKKRHPWVKLTLSDVIEIKKRLEKGEKSKNIAALFGISCGAISDIKRGETWNYV